MFSCLFMYIVLLFNITIMSPMVSYNSFPHLFILRYVINNEKDAVSPDNRGTKVAAYYTLKVPPGGEAVVKLRLCDEESIPKEDPFGESFDKEFANRIEEADDFYDGIIPRSFSEEQKKIARQGYAGKSHYPHCDSYNYKLFMIRTSIF